MTKRDELIQLLARCIAAVASGDAQEAVVLLESARSLLANRQPTLPGVPIPDHLDQPVASATRQEAAARLFDYWRVTCDHASARPSPERVRALAARLRDGYTESEIRKAIDGAAAAPFVSDDGKRFDDLTLVCRNAAKLEDFIARGERATGPVQQVAAAPGTVDEVIAGLRRDMAKMHKEGRMTEYNNASEELTRLLARRKG